MNNLKTIPMMEDKNRSRTILLVDDDKDDRKYFLEALHEIDRTIICTTAKDGEQALELLRDPAFSLPSYIFLDLRMPRVNGKQCLLQIKADERLKKIPVFIYTTSSDVEESEELQGLGAVHFITKPSDPDEIYYVLSFVLEERWNEEDYRSNM